MASRLVLARAANQGVDALNPLGRSSFISQLSLPREPTIATCHSPVFSHSACSISATISLLVAESPVLCISTTTAMTTLNCNKETSLLFILIFARNIILRHPLETPKWLSGRELYFFSDSIPSCRFFYSHSWLCVRWFVQGPNSSSRTWPCATKSACSSGLPGNARS
jgi:hypothetical protein